MQNLVRNQVELRVCDFDATMPTDHQVRAVRAFVQLIDLQALNARIRAVEGSVGCAPIDPAILVSLWLYATLDGVGSARELARLCELGQALRKEIGSELSLGSLRGAQNNKPQGAVLARQIAPQEGKHAPGDDPGLEWGHLVHLHHLVHPQVRGCEPKSGGIIQRQERSFQI